MIERFMMFKNLNFQLYDESKIEGYFQFPKLDATDWVPEDLIGFNYVLNKPDYTKGVHFFLDDYQFERVWNRPDNYVDKLSKFDCVLTPDFSLYTDFPLAMQIWNTYRSRLIGRYWQDCGITVIPTVSWSTHESYNFCFDGLPENSILAISTVGVMKNKTAKELFYDGLEEMITRLHPIGILIWGQKIDYDFPPNVGVAYFKDNRIERVRKEHNGRKRNKLEGENVTSKNE